MQFKVESLQDTVDDLKHKQLECNEEKNSYTTEIHSLNSKCSSQIHENSSLSQQIVFRDEILTLHGIELPSLGSDGELKSNYKNYAELLKTSNEELLGLLYFKSIYVYILVLCGY